jgi:hypothetical protein
MLFYERKSEATKSVNSGMACDNLTNICRLMFLLCLSKLCHLIHDFKVILSVMN